MTSVLGDERLFAVELGEDEAPRPSAPAGEAKTFRRYDQNQCFLLPPSLDEWLPQDHEARFVSEVVENLLDLAPIYASYTSAAGAPPYHPKMMLRLLMFAYTTGVTSSRELERRCLVDVAFRWLSVNEAPDYRSISRFRRRDLAAVSPPSRTCSPRYCIGAPRPDVSASDGWPPTPPSSTPTRLSTRR